MVCTAIRHVEVTRPEAEPFGAGSKRATKRADLLVACSSSSKPSPATGSDTSLASVLACVVIASFGAFAFGYHLGVVNGPLDAIASSLGFAGDAAKKGSVSPASA